MIAESSVVPEGPDLPFYLVIMPWWKRWQEYTSGQTHHEPGPINQGTEMADLC